MLQLGQKLWFVDYDNRRTQTEVVVTKLGRKWAELSNHKRADVVTMQVESNMYGMAGRLYLSQDEYQAELALSAAWDGLKRAVANCHGVPVGMTLERINEASRVLGLL